jgi:hypothetical protein
MAIVLCALVQNFLQEQDFPQRILLQRISRIPEKLLSGALLLRRLRWQSLESGASTNSWDYPLNSANWSWLCSLFGILSRPSVSSVSSVYSVLRIRDPVLFYPPDPGSGSGIRIRDPGWSIGRIRIRDPG